jgi:hypothetical protein
MAGACLCAVVLHMLPTMADADRITTARFDAPTSRYAHGVLGDDIEYGALVMRLPNGVQRKFVLPEQLVFEDISPRLSDVTGDGEPEVIVVESHRDFGARLAVYDATGRIAVTPYIGTRHRWLAPIGAADLDGDGQIEIAYIDRPHLAKTLRVWRLSDGDLVQVASLQGVTNHRIGESYISGGIRHCAGRLPEVFVADGRWQTIVVITMVDGDLQRRDLGVAADGQGFDYARNCGL